MPVPKKRQSKSKSNTRKSVWRQEALKQVKRALSRGRCVLEAAKNTNTGSSKTRQGQKPSLGFGSKQQATNRNKRKPKRGRG